MINDLRPQRDLRTLIVEHKTNPELIDIIVESSFDKSFYENHLRYLKKNLNILCIDSIIIDDNDIANAGYNRQCNRDRIIYLIILLQNEGVGKNVYGIIDKDFLPYTRGLPVNSNILTTDNSSKEMYFFSEENIQRINEQLYEKITPSIVHMIMEEQKKLSYIQILKERESWGIPDIEKKPKYFIIRTNYFEFKSDDYLNNMLNSGGLLSQIQTIKKEIDELKKELMNENIRDCIRGHDFIAFLLLYAKRYADANFTELLLSNHYQIGVKSEEMAKTNLFLKLLAL